jgi:hypothetical protein
MDRLVKVATEIKLHPDDMNREEGFRLSKAWNPSTKLLRDTNTHTLGKSQEDIEKSMLQRGKIIDKKVQSMTEI